MRAAKVQASLRIRAVSPEPSLLAHTSSESRGTFRQKARSLAPLNGWACTVEICHDGMLKDTNSLDGALMTICWITDRQFVRPFLFYFLVYRFLRPEFWPFSTNKNIIVFVFPPWCLSCQNEKEKEKEKISVMNQKTWDFLLVTWSFYICLPLSYFVNNITETSPDKSNPRFAPNIQLKWGNLGLVLKMKNIACNSVLLTKHVKYTY